MKIIFITLLLGISISIFSQEDHSEYFDETFTSPQDVTETCLDCHDEIGDEILKTRHWNWRGPEGTRGKRNIINNFCIATPSNLPRCTSCHIGYGWKDNEFDFTDQSNIDCLVCHDRTGTYKKIPTGAGMVDQSIDLLKIAQNVGPTTRKNCGVCHFDGGGGTGVKHGDMDNSLFSPSYNLDVHMGGQDFQCTECHVTEEHIIAGASHGSLEKGENNISCLDCHEADLHAQSTINKHIKSVACETCHIPEFARKEPTKSWWDWSEAGKNRPIKKDKYGKPTYNNKKGSFKWEKNVVPTYAWFNGSAEYYNIGDEVEENRTVKLNDLNGEINDVKAKISPFKVMKGKQPYDPHNKYLIIPNLYGENGYWKTFNWEEAAEIGMESVDLAFSGKVDFIETEMYWPINHMVPSADRALKCMDCHGTKGKKRLNWNALGYDGDPLRTGGRSLNK